jgi:hypothetical protein
VISVVLASAAIGKVDRTDRGLDAAASMPGVIVFRGT